jgi:hypothetical protein
MMRLGALVGPGTLQPREIDALADERELEMLRRALRRELAVHGGQVGLAREIGVERIVIRKFLEMRTKPLPDNLQKLRDWVENRPPTFTPFGCVLLAALVRDLPSGSRAHTRRELADAMASNYQRAGESIPDWLRGELGMAPVCPEAESAALSPTRKVARARSLTASEPGT